MSTETLPTTKLSMPRLLMHLEGAAILAASLAIYADLQFSWGIFALFLFAPDLSMIFYLINPKIGSIAYNIVHTMILPMALGVISLLTDNILGTQIALIWLAHIGMDHIFGYGLKYPSQFKETHFSRI